MDEISKSEDQQPTTEAPSTPPIPATPSLMPPPTTIPIDIAMFQSLETRASDLSQHLSDTVQQLGLHMNKMSQGTVEAGKVYHSAAQELSTDLATCTQNTAQLIAQCDELDKDLAQIQVLSKQIKAVDKGLGRLLQSLP